MDPPEKQEGHSDTESGSLKGWRVTAGISVINLELQDLGDREGILPVPGDVELP